MMSFYVRMIVVLLPSMLVLTLYRKNTKGMKIMVCMVAVAVFLLAVVPFVRRTWMATMLGFAWLTYVLAIMALLEKGVIGPRTQRPPGYIRKLAVKHPGLSTAIISGGINCFFIMAIGFSLMSQWSGWASAMLVGWPGDKTWLWLVVIWSAVTSAAVLLSSFFVRDWVAVGLGTGCFLTVFVFGFLQTVFGVFPPLTLLQRLFLAFACTVCSCLAGLLCYLVRDLPFFKSVLTKLDGGGGGKA